MSQYIGTDKPTYLGDYNGDMLKIDTQMKANADSASNAKSAAGTAQSVAEKASKDVQALNDSVTANSEDIASLKTKTHSRTYLFRTRQIQQAQLTTKQIRMGRILQTLTHVTSGFRVLTFIIQVFLTTRKVHGTVHTTSSRDC